MTQREKICYLILVISAIGALLWLAFSTPILQDQAYHNFSDQKTIFGIPNFWNVLSNLPFLLVGLLGILQIDRVANVKLPYQVFFIGIALCFFGSSYYHWSPNDASLVWDRLPMTIAFMSMVSVVVMEHVDERMGRKLLWPLVIVGLLSILYWVLSGDLRFYGLVQFYPMIALPLILLCFPSNYNNTSGYWLLFFWYLAAKVLEHFDTEIHDALFIMSGHPLKHIAAAAGVYCLLRTYLRRALKSDA